jgi:hypothetical protein
MPEIPKAILDAGAVVTVLFLVALLVYFILLIIKAVKPKPVEVGTESTGPGGIYRRPSCAYLEANVLQRDRVGRVEAMTKETNEIVKAMRGSMERVADSNEKQEELLGKMLEAMLKRGAPG